MARLQQLKDFLYSPVLDNRILDYAFAFVILVGLVVLLKFTQWLIVSRLRRIAERTITRFDDLIVEIISQINTPTFFVFAVYVASLSLTLDPLIVTVIRYAMVATLTFRAVIVVQRLLKFGLTAAYLRSSPDDLSAITIVDNLYIVMRTALWVLAAIFVLDNLGVNVSAIVAGLGIGGIAVALASQAVLGDALSAVTIFLDKPFQVGDFIILSNGDYLGTVEHIGIKTTRIRSLHGELIVLPNSKLTSDMIRNYKRMDTRRIAFKIGVLYETNAEKVRRIPQLIMKICDAIDGIKLDRVHFLSYGDFSLIYEIVYYVQSPDYNVYMDKQQEINFAIKDVFEKEEIQFAYPTQTLHIPQADEILKENRR